MSEKVCFCFKRLGEREVRHEPDCPRFGEHVPETSMLACLRGEHEPDPRELSFGMFVRLSDGESEHPHRVEVCKWCRCLYAPKESA